jgi:hypothetical protein
MEGNGGEAGFSMAVGVLGVVGEHQGGRAKLTGLVVKPDDGRGMLCMERGSRRMRKKTVMDGAAASGPLVVDGLLEAGLQHGVTRRSKTTALEVAAPAGYTEAQHAKGIEGGAECGTSFSVGDGGGHWLTEAHMGGGSCLGTRGVVQGSPVAASAAQRRQQARARPDAMEVGMGIFPSAFDGCNTFFKNKTLKIIYLNK